ncbi:hypothetical protein EFA46_012185 (plasmid) [Halarchaeum sp. CBA1220]|uniref:DUF7526 family protein n=1 Tax=Halarchaeum sp. CBA1220 TaxID=1853682 RepID=UPI000F3A9867|nr:hypothetical protein [Halarchaeum sp. CBA1220]QLC35009.1 hypothetical protein EFA46_012185 [Halarchaeum sp. CBA1220]
MPETIRGTVLHVVPPADLDDHDLDPELAALAAGHTVAVCRRGGDPSLRQRLRTFLTGGTIDAVTVVLDSTPEEGDSLAVTARETDLAGVYDAT